MNKKVLLVSAFACLLGCTPAQQSVGFQPGRHTETITSGGMPRSYVVDVPKSYDPTKPTPLVIVFHGWSGTGALAEQYTRMQYEGEQQGFVTVFPDGIGKGWNSGFINLTGQSGDKPDDVLFTNDLLDFMEKSINVDKNREYVCGHSNGAFMANYLGSKLGNRLAAIGSVAGTIGIKDKVIPDPIAPISVILIHGKADPTVAYGKAKSAFLNGVGAEESASWWAQKDGCGPLPSTTKSTDGNVVTELYSGGKGDAAVELVSIENGVHNWPGGWMMQDGKPARETKTGVDAADLIWQFFKAHPKG